jgi:hypothetical protein
MEHKLVTNLGGIEEIIEGENWERNFSSSQFSILCKSSLPLASRSH